MVVTLIKYDDIPAHGDPLGLIRLVPLRPQPPGQLIVAGDVGTEVNNVGYIRFTKSDDQLSGVIDVADGDDGVAIVKTPVIISTEQCACSGTDSLGVINGGTP